MSSYLKMAIFASISFLLVSVGLILSNKYIKKQSTKNLVYAIFCILTVLIHYSIVPYSYFANIEYEIEDNLYLPVYPCNIIMWLSLIAAFVRKDTLFFKRISEFLFYCGTVCAFVGIIFNFNFYNTPDLKDFGIFKGLVSHVTLIFSTLYLRVMGYVSISTRSSMLSALVGCAIFVFCGILTDVVKTIQGKELVNGLLLHIDKTRPFYSFYFGVFLGFFVLFVGTTIYETLKYPAEQRWYYKYMNKKNEQNWLFIFFWIILAFVNGLTHLVVEFNY